MDNLPEDLKRRFLAIGDQIANQGYAPIAHGVSYEEAIEVDELIRRGLLEATSRKPMTEGVMYVIGFSYNGRNRYRDLMK